MHTISQNHAVCRLAACSCDHSRLIGQRPVGGIFLRTSHSNVRMQRPSKPQRDSAHKRTDILTRAEDVEAPQSSKTDPDAGVAAEAGSAETALLQPEDRSNGSGGGPRGNPLIAQLYVFGSAVLWGTSAPATRYLFLQGEGQAPVPSVVAAVQTTAAALCLVLIDLISTQRQPSSSQNDDDLDLQDQHTEAAATTDSASSSSLANMYLRTTGSSVSAAGLEIGLWAFIANCSTITGFENTTTSRGTFLIRLSAMFTPIVAAVAGEKFPLPVWLGCLAAFSGGILISADNSSSQAAGGSSLSVSSGDLFIIFAAFMWSVQTVSVGRHASKFAPTTLAKYQLATMSLLSALWLAWDATKAVQGDADLQSLWGGGNQLLNWGVILIPAIGPWSIGTALQAKGQSQLSSAVAMIILASDPLWAILFAGLVGGNEQHLGALGWVGAVAILSASVIASAGRKS